MLSITKHLSFAHEMLRYTQHDKSRTSLSLTVSFTATYNAVILFTSLDCHPERQRRISLAMPRCFVTLSMTRGHVKRFHHISGAKNPSCRDRGCVDDVWGRLRCPGGLHDESLVVRTVYWRLRCPGGLHDESLVVRTVYWRLRCPGGLHDESLVARTMYWRLRCPGALHRFLAQSLIHRRPFLFSTR